MYCFSVLEFYLRVIFAMNFRSIRLIAVLKKMSSEKNRNVFLTKLPPAFKESTLLKRDFNTYCKEHLRTTTSFKFSFWNCLTVEVYLGLSWSNFSRIYEIHLCSKKAFGNISHFFKETYLLEEQYCKLRYTLKQECCKTFWNPIF